MRARYKLFYKFPGSGEKIFSLCREDGNVPCRTAYATPLPVGSITIVYEKFFDPGRETRSLFMN